MLKPLTSFGLLDDDDFLDNNCPLVLDIPEPNTLLPGEIEKARQAALEVIENHSADEALKIFLEDSLEIARDQNGGGGESELGNASTLGNWACRNSLKSERDYHFVVCLLQSDLSKLIVSLHIWVQDIEGQYDNLNKLLENLQDAHEGSKALTKAAAMKAIKQRMEKDAGEVQKIAHVIKAQIEELNRDNLANRQKPRCGKGSAVDHSRTATTFALKKKLKDKMAEFQVSSAVDHVLLKNTALQRAKTLQRNSVKWMCIAIIILLITVAVCHCCGCPKAMEN